MAKEVKVMEFKFVFENDKTYSFFVPLGNLDTKEILTDEEIKEMIEEMGETIFQGGTSVFKLSLQDTQKWKSSGLVPMAGINLAKVLYWEVKLARHTVMMD